MILASPGGVAANALDVDAAAPVELGGPAEGVAAEAALAGTAAPL